MIFWEILRVALSSLAANKLRCALTMLGITIGVFSVIGVMTVIGGMRDTIEGNLNVFGANSFLITKFPAFTMQHPGNRYANRRDINYAQAVRLKELMGDAADVSAQSNLGGRRAYHLARRTNPNVNLMAGDEGLVSGLNYEIGVGRDLRVDDIEFSRAVALLGRDVAQSLFPNEEPIGKKIRIDGHSYTVVGVLAERGSAFGQSRDNLVVVPITRFLQNYGRVRRSMNINVRAPSQEQFAATQDLAIGMMRLVRGLEPEDANDFETISNETLIETFNKIARSIAAAAFVISAIALVAAGVGVMNIMLVSVTERTREIGIRKSVGAKKRSILVQFLIEAVTLSLLGGLGGILLGALAGNLVFLSLNITPAFPWLWAGIGVAVCGGIGVAFGIYPAWRAASLDPIEALRYE